MEGYIGNRLCISAALNITHSLLQTLSRHFQTNMGNLPSTPAAPVLTEHNVGNQSEKVSQARNPISSQKLKYQKVFMITGATSGIGQELAQILFAANATVWIVARSEKKMTETMKTIREKAPQSKGTLKSLLVDFNDLRTIRPAVEEFAKQGGSRIDVLYNNAGIMIPPKGTATVQGYEAQLGVNALAPFLFTKLLVDTLVRTASSSGRPSRVVWVSSSAAANFAPSGGVEMPKLKNKSDADYSQWQFYGISKAASILYSAEFARRYKSQGVESVSMDPGNLATNLYKDMARWQHFLAKKVALKPAIYGAYTELFAGLSSEVGTGSWVVPWGKIAFPRKDIETASRADSEGGTATEFWDWCETQVSSYAV